MSIIACAANDCQRPAKTRGLCPPHYMADYAKRPGAGDLNPAKACKKCQTIKPIAEFTLLLKAGVRRDVRCKDCVRASQRANPKKATRNREWERRQYADPQSAFVAARRLYLRGVAHERRARIRGNDIERFPHEDVFARDGYICQLCGGVIDKSLEYPHPASRSIDHIVPIARGGAHTFVNVQAAHLRCNLAKGARAT